MIPILTIYLLNKLGFRVDLDVVKLKFKQFLINLKSIFWILPLLFLLLSSSEMNKPEKVDYLTFEIFRKSNRIGMIHVEKQLFEDRIRYEISSSIDTRLLIKIEAEGKETSEFVNGVLTYSSVFRKLSNKTKSNHQVVLDNGSYKMKSNGEIENLKIGKIYQNLVSLYFNEPNPLYEVYCDNDGTLAEIIKIKPNVYKVEIAPGKYNIYHYEKGRCVRVDSHTAFYSVKLIAN
ncbi:DUF6134 family protein [Aegicerativicinus sediminis]|uniref:DUF6134 family protein n=1 Tax=Aegicerativicinus sediminis TaxID=2893202 RepID=UPI001E644C7B|nr:DUF6134 family protein [Aegicerativicinus sediminis]